MPLTDSDIDRIGEVIENKLQPITTRLALGDKQLADLSGDVDAHEYLLKGNGKPGLIADVQRLKERAEASADFNRIQSTFRQRLFLVAVGAIFPFLGAGAVAAGWALLKMVPHP